MALIEAHTITRSFKVGEEELAILKGVSLQIQTGEFVALTGKSGSGKSTLMNIIGCLDLPTSGTYQFDGVVVAHQTPDELAHIRNKKIGFVFQTFNLLEDLTATDNVALPALYAGVAEHTAREHAQELLQRLDLGERLHHYPRQLSGGQRQRVAIARSLINKPALILADEPTGNLDSQTGQYVMSIFRELNKQENITFVLVTHDDDLAAETDRIIRLVDGKIAQ